MSKQNERPARNQGPRRGPEGPRQAPKQGPRQAPKQANGPEQVKQTKRFSAKQKRDQDTQMLIRLVLVGLVVGLIIAAVRVFGFDAQLNMNTVMGSIALPVGVAFVIGVNSIAKK